MDIYALSIIFITHIGMNDPLSDEIWPLSESQGIPDIQNGIFFFICLKKLKMGYISIQNQKYVY